jgi:hypothetical protein
MQDERRRDRATELLRAASMREPAYLRAKRGLHAVGSRIRASWRATRVVHEADARLWRSPAGTALGQVTTRRVRDLMHAT